MNFKKLLGYVWSAPVTIFGLAYASVFKGVGWYDWLGVKDDALVWKVSSNAPTWLRNMWKGWAGHAIGNVVVLLNDPEKNPIYLQHEMVHVRQCMRLGIFQPIVYGICMAAIKLGCEDSHPYYDNIFEIDARRAVGQKVDVTSILKKS